MVTWKVVDGFDGEFFVYRSYFNNNDWVLMTPSPIRGRSSWSDTTLDYDNQFTQPYYRIALRHKGVIYDSPVIRASDKLTPAEFRHVRRMMNVEQKGMDKGRNGIRVLLYAPLLEGTPASGVDPDTGQQFNLGNTDPAKDCFGQQFVGGFSPPVITWVKFSAMGALQIQDMKEGESTDVNRDITARMLAYPEMTRGDLIVHPETDNRYAVGGTIEGFFFRGTIPVAYNVKLQLLQRSDPRYRVPVPQIPEDPRL